jgi:hypothetical protein
LFSEIPKDPNRLGAVSYPLIGIFPEMGEIKVDESDVAYVGVNILKWAEQHVHLVDIDSMWHFGPDMAKFKIDPEAEIVSFWVVMIDLSAFKINYTYTMIVRPDKEDQLEKSLQNCSEFSSLSGIISDQFGKDHMNTLNHLLG